MSHLWTCSLWEMLLQQWHVQFQLKRWGFQLLMWKGIRSGDWSMPEEINRIVTDSITNYFFTTSATANENFINANVKKENIYFVGNTMIDTLLSNLDRLKSPSFGMT